MFSVTFYKPAFNIYSFRCFQIQFSHLLSYIPAYSFTIASTLSAMISSPSQPVTCTFFNIRLLGFKFHVIGGIIFGALILVHIIVNRKWVVNITKRIFDKNLKTRTRISYIISFCLLVTVCAILVSGICIMKAANYDRVMFWKMLHIGASYLSIALIGLHLGLYWNFVSNFFKKMFNIKNSGTMSIIIARIVVVAILVNSSISFTFVASFD